MSTRRVYHMAYAGPLDEVKPHGVRTGLHRLRDGHPAIELLSLLLSEPHRYQYGATLLNFPPGAFRSEPADRGSWPSGLAEHDLVLLTTRPPLDDDRGQLRIVDRSESPLEDSVLTALQGFFQRCARDTVVLDRAVVKRLPDDEARNRAAISFRVQDRTPGGSGCVYRRGQNVSAMAPLTDDTAAGYLAYVPHIQRPDGAPGPGLLLAFSLSGTMNLLWSNLVRACLGWWVTDAIREDRRRLLVGEFTPDFGVGRRPTALCFLEPKVDVVVDVWLDFAASPARGSGGTAPGCPSSD